MQTKEGRMQFRRKIVVLLLPLAAAGVFVLFRPWMRILAEQMPACMFYRLTGFYCPACGNTRSVLALLDFDLFSALRYNITPALLLLAALFGYLELLGRQWGKKIRLFPRSARVNFVLLGLLILYYVVRNLGI